MPHVMTAIVSKGFLVEMISQGGPGDYTFSYNFSTPRNWVLAFGASCCQNSTLGLNTCRLLPTFNLHPPGSPVAYPASLKKAEAITC